MRVFLLSLIGEAHEVQLVLLVLCVTSIYYWLKLRAASLEQLRRRRVSESKAAQLVRKSLRSFLFLSLSWVTLLYEYFCIRRLFTPSSGNKGGIFATTWLTPAGSPLSLRSTIPPSQQRWFRGYTPTMQCHAQEISACFPLVLLNPKLPFLFFVLHAHVRTQRDREY